MTRLFLRFYLGVLAILLVAWGILGYVYRARSETQNIRVVEVALGGGAKLAREKLCSMESASLLSALASVQSDFDYPVNIVRWTERPMDERLRERLLVGDAVLYKNVILIALPDNQRLLELGPLPAFVGPSQTEVTLGIGAIFALSAIAIAFLLRPVAMQLQAVERTATAISEGDLSARIDGTQTPKGIAFAVAFNKMADRVETLLRTQRELLQAVSHELRTPLAKIRFAAELIESSTTDEERLNRLAAVDNATQKLDDLVGELLTYVRLESVAAATELTSVELNELFVDLIDTHAPLHPTVKFEIVGKEQPSSLMSDRSSLSVAIGNLIANAARFANAQVQIRALREHDSITIEVDDDGPGIAEADWERVFEPFVRLDELNQRGTGLGLALVNRIATRCGGHASVGKSDLGGAKFSLVMPHRESAAATP